MTFVICTDIQYFVKKCESLIQKSYEFSLENGKKETEDVDISVDGNFVQYHVQDNDTEVWVINDFNTVSSQIGLHPTSKT